MVGVIVRWSCRVGLSTLHNSHTIDNKYGMQVDMDRDTHIDLIRPGNNRGVGDGDKAKSLEVGHKQSTSYQLLPHLMSPGIIVPSV